MNRVKNIISISVIIAIISCITVCSGCSDSEKPHKTGTPVLTLATDNAAPLPGEEFNITVSVENGAMFCYMDLFLNYNEDVIEYVSYESAEIDGFNSDAYNSSANKLYYAAYVATTADITSDSLVVFTFKVIDGIAPGADCSVKFSEDCKYAVGLDERGDDVSVITDSVNFNNCTVTVG